MFAKSVAQESLNIIGNVKNTTLQVMEHLTAPNVTNMEKEIERRIADNLAESIRDMMAQSHASTNKMYSQQHGEILEKLSSLRDEVKDNNIVLAEHIKEDKAFQERIEPYLEGAAGFKLLRDLGIWAAGGLVAWSTIKGYFKS